MKDTRPWVIGVARPFFPEQLKAISRSIDPDKLVRGGSVQLSGRVLEGRDTIWAYFRNRTHNTDFGVSPVSICRSKRGND